MSKVIMGIQLQQRQECAPDFQELLTKYGCIIQTRLGLHTATDTACSPHGLIILDFMEGTDKQIHEFEKELSEIKNAIVKKMVF